MCLLFHFMPVYWHYLLHIGPLNLGVFNQGLSETGIERRLDFIQQVCRMNTYLCCPNTSRGVKRHL